MNYFIPGQQGQPELFIANASGQLGSYDKAVDAIVMLKVDYSALSTVRTVASFRVTPGGSPQLSTTSPQVDSAALMSFVVQGGIGGRTYTVVIDTVGPDLRTDVRSDVLTINVLGDDCNCEQPIVPVTNIGYTSPDGSLYVNTAPRMFVSATPPNGARVMDQWWNTTTRTLSTFISNGVTTYWMTLL